MNYVTIETTGTEVAYKLGTTIKALVADTLEAQKNDGKISADEIAAIAMKNFNAIMAVVGEIKNVGGEVKEAPVAFARSLIIPLSEIGDLFLNKEIDN